MNTNDIRSSSYYALRRWGYTLSDAEQEGRVALWELDRDVSKAYLIRVLTNREIDKKRRLKNSSIHFQFEDYDSPVEMELDDFGKMIGSLSRDRQELLTMAYYFGYTTEEMAAKLDIPTGTVKSRLSRACDKLREN